MALQNGTTQEYIVVVAPNQDFNFIMVKRYKSVTVYNTPTEWDVVKIDGIFVENNLTTKLALACNNATIGNGSQSVMTALITACELSILAMPDYSTGWTRV